MQAAIVAAGLGAIRIRTTKGKPESSGSIRPVSSGA
jgi:hypothetical protein